jgi:hypothetical protein
MSLVAKVKNSRLMARTALLTGSLGIVGMIGFGAVSAAQNTISGTGYGSSNTINDSTITTTRFTNNNKLSTTNSNSQSSSSGSASSNGNTTGGSSTSGSTSNSDITTTSYVITNSY